LLTLTRVFALEYYAYRFDAPSLTSVYRYLGLLGLFRKKIEYIHRDKNSAEQVEYLLRIRHINPCLFVNIDGMVQKAEDFLAKYGWSPTG
jgi:ribosomal protein L30/L7E